ncbi:MAG TPA: type VI secretion system-associated FHA domain protein TagH [Acetobacteraceae bacterium]|nr:type VI secretion system-associated FHA domain protein TagH [Acetobacteraceae bacterium]
MALTLSILRCPEGVAPESRRIERGRFSIGRGPENDWMLADPERHLSKRHCLLAWRRDEWHVADLSTNGTYLNREATPIGRDQAQALRDGDRLRFGAYEIEVRITEEPASLPPRRAGRAISQADPFGDDPFAAPPAAPGTEAETPALPSFGGIALPPDDDRLRPPDGPVQPDHSPALADAFRPPRPAAGALPDDWDRSLSLHARPPVPQAARAAPEPAAAPAAAPPPAAPPAADAGLLAAFLAGAGLPDAAPADPAATMHALGMAFRAMVGGLRQAMIARAEIKGEFRIERTVLRRAGNNPLKFAADDDDALMGLLGFGRRSDMGAAASVADALGDIRAHELAVIAAMRGAVRALLAELDPARLRQETEAHAVLPGQRKARAWEAYERLYAATLAGLDDRFDDVFGKAFAQAYEQAVREVAKAP